MHHRVGVIQIHWNETVPFWHSLLSLALLYSGFQLR